MWSYYDYYLDTYRNLTHVGEIPADGRFIPKRSTVIKNKRQRRRG